jgi:hypothetical protein
MKGIYMITHFGGGNLNYFRSNTSAKVIDEPSDTPNGDIRYKTKPLS